MIHLNTETFWFKNLYVLILIEQLQQFKYILNQIMKQAFHFCFFSFFFKIIYLFMYLMPALHLGSNQKLSTLISFFVFL